MKIKILKESGYEEAILGLSLSYNTTIEKATDVSLKLYNKDGGHNKFLRFISVWLDITAPRFFWQEFSTYAVGVSVSSESTIHTLMKRELTSNDFEEAVLFTHLDTLNEHIKSKDFYRLKNELPEGFLQRRIVNLNYMVLRNIIAQRKNHRLPQWKWFNEHILKNIEHKEYFKDME